MKSYYDHTMGKPALTRSLVHHINTLDTNRKQFHRERPCYFCAVFMIAMGAGVAWMALRLAGVL